ncbi:hypothetical protein [Nocardia wallacei]|uniref:Uncharacterized protein n=1 Tax=Nocardia wallacei TaxID=480035 RepID=A0A7G1KII3_9NOCA|nr:hypothetical protein [Nocardia wallacei]BCK54316.1 hypothetical protein NWFMUON74_20880 [Nocardia wallacei]
MALPRVVWLVVAVAAALWGVFVATEPLYQISSCEAVNMDAVCGNSIFARYGAGLVALSAVPVVLCAVPAAPALRRYSWLAAATILLISAAALTANDSVFGALAYYLPVGVLALAVAWLQRWYERRRNSLPQ